MKNMNTTAVPSCGKEARSELINLFILGKAFIDRSGLRTRNIFKELTFTKSKLRSSTTAVNTTVKSSQFHGSLIYEFLCMQNPIAIILRIASIVKILEKI